MKKSRRKKFKQPGNTMILFMVKLGFTDLNPMQKISRSNNIVKKMTGNNHFLNPIPSLAQVSSAISALSAAQTAKDGAKAKTAMRNLREAELDLVMKLLQSYVEFIAKGDTDIILSSGFDVCEKPRPVGLLPFSSGFTAVNTPSEGQISLKWKRVHRRVTYIIEYTLDPNVEGNRYHLSCTKTKVLLTGLSPDSRYYFRISTTSAAGNSGFGPWISCRPN